MKNTCFLLLFSLLTISCFAQKNLNKGYNHTSFSIFVKKANIREAPSISSKIIGTANHAETIMIQYPWKAVDDNVEDVAGQWIKVVYNKKVGYIWSHLTSDNVFRSQQFLNDVFFVRAKNNKTLEVKVFRNKRFKKEFKFELNFDHENLKFLGAVSLGNTFNSDGKDIFVFYYLGEGKSELKYYSWDGLKLEEFKGKLHDESFVNYKRDSSAVITAAKVRFREEPNLKSNTIELLDPGTIVDELKEFQEDTINGKSGFWSKVIYGEKTGYVWKEYLSDLYFYSYKEDALLFAFKQEEILAIRKHKIIARHAKYLDYNDAFSNGAMGVEGISDIISLNYQGESCGVPNGNVYMGWDGKKFYDFIDGTGVGDGGLSYGSAVTFPSYLNGKKGIIQQNRYDGETIDLPVSTNGEGYKFVSHTDLNFDYFFNGDSLEVIPSTLTKISRNLKETFPDYKVGHFAEGDLNQDGHSDVVLYAYYAKPDYDEQKSNKSLVVVLLNDNNGNYWLKTSSKTLIEHRENIPLSEILILKDGFQVNIYYSGYYNEEYNNDQYEMVYKYENDNFFLRKATHHYSIQEQGENYWEKKDYSYITNNILFKDSYTPEEE